MDTFDRIAWGPLHHVAIAYKGIRLRERLAWLDQTCHPEITALLCHLLIQTQIVLIHNDLTIGLLLQFLAAHDVIQMTMRDENALQSQTLGFEFV